MGHPKVRAWPHPSYRNIFQIKNDTKEVPQDNSSNGGDDKNDTKAVWLYLRNVGVAGSF